MPLVQDPRFALHAEEKRTPLRVLQDVRGPVDQERARTAARTSLSCARRSEGIAHTFSGRRLRYVFSTELACFCALRAEILLLVVCRVLETAPSHRQDVVAPVTPMRRSLPFLLRCRWRPHHLQLPFGCNGYLSCYFCCFLQD